MNKKSAAIHLLVIGEVMGMLASACGPRQFLGPTLTPMPTITLTASPTPSPTETRTLTPTPTNTAPPTATFSPTAVPQSLLLRRKCGRDYIVRANEPIQIFYGGWGVIGKSLADQWTTALVAEFTMDGEVIAGELQPPTKTLPYNCTTSPADVYWLYYIVTLPGLSPGDHYIKMKFSALQALPDGTGPVLGPGPLLEQNFKITAR